MHTRTGNPLVDSVAEHQPGTPDAYWRYLHYSYYVAPLGFVVSAAHYVKTRDASALFLPLYAMTAYYFANRMVRLIIFLGPIASSLTGVGAGYLLDDIADNIRWLQKHLFEDGPEGASEDDEDKDKDEPKASNGGRISRLRSRPTCRGRAARRLPRRLARAGPRQSPTT